ncbi:hypothetical protein FRC02_009100 [Tulasnella sp. 418]|nr:hypothetical protein FRC02_009100 [Tulasnella sp. 418]
MLDQLQWPESFGRLKTQVNALLLELGRGPGSLYSEIADTPPDIKYNPEVQWDATVRLGDGLCFSERAYLKDRKRKMLSAFAKLMDVAPSEIDERDLPIIAIAASGGGFRAMCNTAGALVAAERSGILDCTTYMAGISGSCWSMGALYSGVSGSYSPTKVAEHLRKRASIPYIDSAVLDLLVNSPTNKYLLSGLVRKAITPLGSIQLVDIYGTLLAARLLTPTPENIQLLDPRHLSLSHFSESIKDASLPLPIFAAVSRHLSEAERKIKAAQRIVADENRAATLRGEEELVEKEEANWLWYEFSPYEIGCDELGAWVPSWSLGRQFNRGRSLERLPEVSFTIYTGIFASAFTASLRFYFAEVQPLLRQLPSMLYTWIGDIIDERQHQFDTIHPIVPGQLPNFVKGLDGKLRSGSPDGITDSETIGFMDAGMALNIPYYPLLRRNVDCIIALDASADSQDLWFKRASAYAVRKGLKTWPRGAHWPKEIALNKSEADAPLEARTDEPQDTREGANLQLAQAREAELAGQAQKQLESGTKEIGDENSSPLPNISGNARDQASSAADGSKAPTPSTFVWIGSSNAGPEAGEVSPPIEHFDEGELASKDGIGIVYMPLLPNEEAVPGMDPYSISTWRFEMTMEESGDLMKIAEYNFLAGEPKIKALIKAIWLRKKRARETKEREKFFEHFEHSL